MYLLFIAPKLAYGSPVSCWTSKTEQQSIDYAIERALHVNHSKKAVLKNSPYRVIRLQHLKCVIFYVPAKIWNSLLSQITAIKSASHFSVLILSHLMSSYTQ